MRLYEVVDEQDRIQNIFFTTEEPREEAERHLTKSHTVSYLYARKMYQKMGEIMGLDRLPISDSE